MAAHGEFPWVNGRKKGKAAPSLRWSGSELRVLYEAAVPRCERFGKNWQFWRLNTRVENSMRTGDAHLLDIAVERSAAKSTISIESMLRIQG